MKMEKRQQLFKLTNFATGTKKEKPDEYWYRLKLRVYDVKSGFVEDITEFVTKEVAEEMIRNELDRTGFEGIDVTVELGYDKFFRKSVIGVHRVIDESEVIFC